MAAVPLIGYHYVPLFNEVVDGAERRCSLIFRDRRVLGLALAIFLPALLGAGAVLRWYEGWNMPTLHNLLFTVVTFAASADAAKRAPITVQPYCRPSSADPPPVKGDEAAAVAAGTRAAAAPALDLDKAVIDVAFFETRSRVDFTSMRRAAALVNATTARVRFHALLKFPQEVPGFRVTELKLPPLAQCLYDGMRRISHGPGPQYLYKPLLHWVMPREVEKLILLY